MKLLLGLTLAGAAAASWLGLPERPALAAPKLRNVELFVRPEPGGLSTVDEHEHGVALDVLDWRPRGFRIFGTAAGRALMATASMSVKVEYDETVEFYSIDGSNVAAFLEPMRHGAFELKGYVDGLPVLAVLRPAGSGPELTVRDRGLALQSRDVGNRVRLAGTFDAALYDARRLALVGAALAIVRLDAPVRREE